MKRTQAQMMNMFTASDNYTATSTTLPIKSRDPSQDKSHDKRMLPKVTVKFGTTEIRMLIDSGASVNIVDNMTYKLLAQKLPIQTSDIKLYPYGSENPLPVVGKFEASVKSNHKTTTTTFDVVNKSSGSLLSYDTACSLDLIDFNVNAVKFDYTQSPLTSLNELLATYDDTFKGIGKLTTH